MRLVFSAGGLASTTFAISPLHHAMFAALCLRHPGFAVPGSPWRDLARRAPARAMPFVDRVNSSHLGEGGFLWINRPLPPGVGTFADELDAHPGLDDVADAVRAFYTSCVEPEWNAIRRRVEAHLSRCAELLCVQGFGRTLPRLNPRLSWYGCALEIDTSGVTPPAMDLGDRGVAFSPLLSAGHRFLGLALGHDSRLILAYPVADAVDARPGPVDALALVLGHARARVLRSIGTGTATGALARSLQVSASTVSEHMTALRQAGLVDTYREGRAVRHVLTSLGRDLLECNA
ncbi:ArsR/SmtB family transcription factor [Nonomuraea sp. NPDC050556]|uniref:ArsR/SmtB family transcription factor n=1 Tax=Nonomuraea sp. NPDC050556 TaxID=3364369 RepID=UPI00378FF8E2